MNLTITDRALQKVLAILESERRAGQGLRVSASGGPAAGIRFALNFEDGGGSPGDTVVEAGAAGQLKIHVDPGTAPLLEGGSIDYLESLSGAGFKVHAPLVHLAVPVPPKTQPAAPDPEKPAGPQAEKVQEILDTLVNPGVASHGGWVGLVDVKDNVVFLRLGGGCQGCGGVDITLKQGIEVMIKERMPEISAVYDVTDHAEGKNPYYSPSARH